MASGWAGLGWEWAECWGRSLGAGVGVLQNGGDSSQEPHGSQRRLHGGASGWALGPSKVQDHKLPGPQPGSEADERGGSLLGQVKPLFTVIQGILEDGVDVSGLMDAVRGLPKFREVRLSLW